MTTRINKRGFTLVEVLAAIVVFAFGMLALYRLQAATVVNNTFSNELTQSNAIAQVWIETLMSLPYDDPGDGTAWLNDTDGDGTGKDANADGFDDGGANLNFGLDHIDAAADVCRTIDVRTNAETPNCAAALRPGIDFRISQNIAVDQPLNSTKTIRIIAAWLDNKRIPHRTTFTCMKAVGY